jgi:hypothetical protein
MPVVTSDIVALAAILITGVVAVASLLLPLVIERLKWRAERRDSTVEAIDSASMDLLKHIAILKSGNVELATQRPFAEIFSRMLADQYIWEQRVRPYLKVSELERLRQIRERAEGCRSSQGLHPSEPDLAREVLDLTETARERV